jgi:SAM-dependent methyltransferase
MDHCDHVGLLRPGVEGGSGVWADVGSGQGAFTLALADLLGPRSRIVSIDRDGGALRAQAAEMAARFPDVWLEQREADFTGELRLPDLGGLVAANSLHFVAPERQLEVVAALAGHLHAGGRFVVVEYDAERGNPWVPHPISFERWRGLAEDAGLVRIRLTGRVPSRFHGSIYSAVAERG